MRARWLTAAAICVALCASGCARFAFYSNADLTGRETGIKFYTPKPYLLVARTGAQDKPTEVSVIYIPDLARPIYAQLRTGIGSANLTMTLSNGMLTTIGQDTDTKIPELITALGGFATSVATARKTSREASLLKQAAQDYSSVSRDLATIASDLRLRIDQAAKSKQLSQLELQAADGIANTLEGASQLLADPTKAELNVPAVIVNLKSALDIWSKQLPPPAADAKGADVTLRRQIATLQVQTQGTLAKLLPKEPEEAVFSLYEIDNSTGVTILKEVKF
jgi:uncharacterized membrane-anchored protein YhcB (DUF1043 family)